MNAPRCKRVTSEVFVRIAQALDEMSHDDNAKRTKREVERRSNLSHDAVDRAFKQDMKDETQWGINHKFTALKEGRATRVSPERCREIENERALADLREALMLERRLNERYMMALFAMHLDATDLEDGRANTVIPMGRNRNNWGDRR